MKGPSSQAPSALACGLLEDGGRALFLCRKSLKGAETVELPCCLLFKGENPVAKLAEVFRMATGIDAQVHDVLFERRYSIGSRRRKTRIPALVFGISAKSHKANPFADYSGCRWIASKDLAKHRLAKSCEWLR